MLFRRYAKRFSWAGVCLTGLLPLFAHAADDPVWRKVDPENLVFMELYEGQVAIELNPLFAPKTVRQFRNLVQDHFYDGLSFYRVIDGFVAQGGDGSDLGELSLAPLIKAEFESELPEDIAFMPVQKDDLFAPETGFVDGFAVAPGCGRQECLANPLPGSHRHGAKRQRGLQPD